MRRDSNIGAGKTGEQAEQAKQPKLTNPGKSMSMLIYILHATKIQSKVDKLLEEQSGSK